MTRAGRVVGADVETAIVTAGSTGRPRSVVSIVVIIFIFPVPMVIISVSVAPRSPATQSKIHERILNTVRTQNPDRIPNGVVLEVISEALTCLGGRGSSPCCNNNPGLDCSPCPFDPAYD